MLKKLRATSESRNQYVLVFEGEIERVVLHSVERDTTRLMLRFT